MFIEPVGNQSREDDRRQVFADILDFNQSMLSQKNASLKGQAQHSPNIHHFLALSTPVVKPRGRLCFEQEQELISPIEPSPATVPPSNN